MKIAIIRTKAFFLMVADVRLSHMLKQIACSHVSVLVRDETPVKTACLPKIVVFRFPTFADDFFPPRLRETCLKLPCWRRDARNHLLGWHLPCARGRKIQL